jgi:F420-dependent oxidoreductase-like protein
MTRFGLQIPGFTFPGTPDGEMFDRVAELATTAEQVGFDSVWVMDHFWQLPPLGGPDQPILEGYTLLGALAARTERVELGTLVTGVTYRNPALVAQIVTTLDVISRGRAVCGIGAAWYEEEHVGLGFDFPSVRERMDRLDEALTIIRAMFTEDAPSFNGRYYRIEGARNLPRPVRPGGPPILVGGSGEKRTLRLVAQHADLCNIFGAPDTLRHKLDVLRGHCADAGRDPDEITKSWLGTLVLTETADEAEGVKDLLRGAIGPDWQERSIVGDADGVAEQVSGLLDAGLDMLIVNMPTADTATVARAGKLLTSEFT